MRQNYFTTNAMSGFGSAAVLRTNSNGFFFSGTNATERANALSNALRVAQSGDIVQLSPGLFMSGNKSFNIPRGVTLQGSGGERTILSKTTYSADQTNRPVVFMHVETALKDLCVSNSAPIIESVQGDIAISHSGGIGGEILLQRVKVYADTDGIYPLLSGIHLQIVDCDFIVKYDALNIGSDVDGGSCDVYNSRITAVGNSQFGLYARGVVAADGGVVRIYNSVITAIGVNATAETAALATSDTGRMEIYNSTIIYSNNNATAYGAHNGGGGIKMINCTVKSIGTTTNDFFDDSGAPENNLLAYVNSTGVFVGDGRLITALNASAIGSGTVPTARLGSGTANSGSFLRGDQTWATIASGSSNNVWATIAGGGALFNTNGLKMLEFSANPWFQTNFIMIGNPTDSPSVILSTGYGFQFTDRAANATNISARTITVAGITNSGIIWMGIGPAPIGISNGVNGGNIIDVRGALTNLAAKNIEAQGTTASIVSGSSMFMGRDTPSALLGHWTRGNISFVSDGKWALQNNNADGFNTLMLHTGSGISNGINGLNVVNNAGVLTNVAVGSLTGPADMVEVRNGTAAQTLRVYRTFTDSSNYRGWSIENQTIAWAAAGTGVDGSAANIYNRLNGAMSFGTANTARWNIEAAGQLTGQTAGTTVAIKSGTNAKAGTFTLVAGTVVVANTSVTANSVIVVTVKTPGGVRLGVPDCVPNPGTGFTATEVGGVGDTSTYNYVILEVN